MVIELTTEDVLRVAKDLSFKTPSTTKIDYVRSNINDKALEDPSGNIPVWIEQLLEDADAEMMTEEEVNFLQKAKAFADKLNIECYELYDTHLEKEMEGMFGGYRFNESSYIVVTKYSKLNATIYSQCMNCGDTNSLNVTKIVENGI